MSKVDPTGFQAALATIQPGQLSERQQRIAMGLAMIEAGKTVSAASRECGIPRMTLWGYAQGVTKLGNENEGRRGRDLETLHDACLDNALLASEMLRDALTQDEWTHADLVKALGVNVDKLAVLGQRTSPAPDGIRELFASVLTENEIVLRKRDPIGDAVEVAAEIG